MKITIEMNSGSRMNVEAKGTFCDGELDAFECYWPCNEKAFPPHGKRPYRVIPERLYNVDKAAQEYEEAVVERNRDWCD